MLTVAWAVATSAQERTESRGCHRRTDFADPREIWLRHLTVRLDRAGARVRTARRRIDVLATRPSEFHPLGEATRSHLIARGLDPDAIAALVRAAVTEDLAGGIDVTTVATVPAEQRSVGELTTRKAGTVAGLPVAAAVIDTVCGDDASDVELLRADGDHVEAGVAVARVTAPTRALLTAERTTLNLLCHLSGIATLTARWVEAIAGTPAAVRDTRKTTPGLRALEKYAVRCGGGVNHRMSLSDAALVKDNHVVAAGGVAAAFTAVRALDGQLPIEIEVDSLDGLREAIEAGADLVLLDNFDLADLRAAVALRAGSGRAVLLEASGGLTLDRAAEVAATGIDYISVGELTHSAPVLDLGLDLRSVVGLTRLGPDGPFDVDGRLTLARSPSAPEPSLRSAKCGTLPGSGLAWRGRRGVLAAMQCRAPERQPRRRQPPAATYANDNTPHRLVSRPAGAHADAGARARGFGERFDAPRHRAGVRPAAGRQRHVARRHRGQLRLRLDPVTGACSGPASCASRSLAADVGCVDLVPNVGVTGTPVVDPDTGTMYLVAKGYVDNNPANKAAANAGYWLYSIDIATGATSSPPSSSPEGRQPGEHARPTATFAARDQIQRPALMLVRRPRSTPPSAATAGRATTAAG